MRRILFRSIGALAALLAVSGAQAALFDRGGGLVYDDVLNITWLQDANYAQTTGFDADGKMTWDAAVAWANGLVYTNAGGTYSDWRLPTITDLGNDGCNYSFDGTDCGFNVDTSTGEMAHLFYDTLGNLAQYDTSGTAQAGYGLSNSGPFFNVQAEGPGDFNGYWSSTAFSPDLTNAWRFYFGTGRRNATLKSITNNAWAVMDGDVAAIPVPAAVWLLSSALGLVGFLRRRAA